MYITQIKLNINNHLVFKDLTSLSAYHGWLEEAFPAEQLLGVRKRHLWRLDKTHGQPVILLLSEDKPDLKVLSKYAVKNGIHIKKYNSFINSIKKGQIRHFKIVANPVRRNKHSTRIPLTTNAERLDWLSQKGKENGFKLMNVQVTDVSEHHVRSHRFSLRTATYTGTLFVTDADLFKKALTQGLGREKAYGNGLLTVA